jgi:hypothetical protein
VAVPLLVFAPLVLLAHLLFLAGGEVVLDVESLADLLGGLALDHVGDSLAGHIEKAFNVQVVSSLKVRPLVFCRACGNKTHQNEFKESSLVNFEEVSVPAANVVGALLFVLIILGWRRVVFVEGSPLDHFLQDGRVDIGQRHNFLVIFIHA